MTKFINSSFTVGPKPGEKITDEQWEIAVGLRSPKTPALDALAQAEVTEGLYDLTRAFGYFDGGSSHNPGIGASAWALTYPDGSSMTGTKGLGIVTNNEAEYVGLIDLMTYALEHGVTRIRIHGDSQLIVNQTLGKWKVKDADLKPLAKEAKRLAAQFERFELVWIPREDNGQCDGLVKQVIKEQK